MGKVKVKLFGHLRHAAGTKEAEFDITDNDTLKDVIDKVVKRFGMDIEERIFDKGTGKLAPFLIMVGGKEISTVKRDLKIKVQNGDEISLLEPVGGG